MMHSTDPTDRVLAVALVAAAADALARGLAVLGLLVVLDVAVGPLVCVTLAAALSAVVARGDRLVRHLTTSPTATRPGAASLPEI
ncbi:MAG: hypothetical protein AAF772_15295 [Acidobacteriota bacterium]